MVYTEKVDDQLVAGPSPLKASDRLIVALDVRTKEEAFSLVEKLDGLVSFFKVGYQLLLAEGMAFVRELVKSEKKVFLDLKMDDVEETIKSAVEVITEAGVTFITIHGNGATARAAREGRGKASLPKLLSLTLLTSLDEQDLKDMRIVGKRSKFKDLNSYVVWRADEAVNEGCDGLISAGSSVSALRKKFGPKTIIVAPGVRLKGETTHDHKRVTTPRDATLAGADYLVVGRPIRHASDPRGAADRIISEIHEACTERES